MSTPENSLRKVQRFLSQYSFNTNSEEQLQAEMEQVLSQSGLSFSREVLLDEGSRIDFMIEGVGVECKIQGSPLKIYRQCERYCGFEDVTALLLVTSKAVNLPSTINDKPAKVFSVGLGSL